MRRGFTLVEMLVATALVMLIMLLFARIFEEAIATVRSQRSIIANDEKTRAVSTMLRTDLDHASYRASVGSGATAKIRVPTGAGVMELIQSPRGLVALSTGDRVDPHQRGFLFISENDPFDGGDDVLHFTVSVLESVRDPLASNPNFAPYQGRAANLTAAGAGNNQPDFDDGVNNSAATSRAAEVCYFLRGTTLYRRVQLIRDPLTSASPPFGTQPTSAATGLPMFQTYPTFYRDFDFAATNFLNPAGTPFVQFHGLESLDNSLGLSNTPLSAPFFRFGYNPTSGLPREYGADATYFGRFTQEETSVPGFQWPGVNNGAGNNIVDSPLVVSPSGIVAVDTNTSNAYDPGVDTLLQNTGVASRTGEDILMTGVETFNIEAWDNGYAEGDFDGSGAWDPLVPADDRNLNGIQDAGAWVNFGNNQGIGMFTETWANIPNSRGNTTWGRQNNAYGPGGPTGNHVFDTWHPSLQPLVGATPYRPRQISPAGAYVWAPTPSAPVAGAVLFPDAAVGNDTIAYVALNADGVRQTGARVPEWPREPGAIVTDGALLWQCFDNRIGLEKIRITIRFRDPGTSQPRQVSIVHSFVE